MASRPTITAALARLVQGEQAPAAARRYRPLIAGPAVMRKRAGEVGPWTVDLACDRMLLPRPPRDAEKLSRLYQRLAGLGIICRMGAVVAGPFDAAPPGVAPDEAGRLPRLAERPDGPLRLDMYGWALLYQPPGMQGRGLVDVDDRFPDLPAVFELPLELLDRADFLESRGFRTRPLVIPTQPEDFVRGPDGRLRNRYFPGAAFRSPCTLDRLV